MTRVLEWVTISILGGREWGMNLFTPGVEAACLAGLFSLTPKPSRIVPDVKLLIEVLIYKLQDNGILFPKWSYQFILPPVP